MSNMKDKLAANLRQVKAAATETPVAKPAVKPKTPAKPKTRAAAEKAAPARRAVAKPKKTASSVTRSEPKAKASNLFPTRIWPD
ncbi:hypothetical protein SAMN05216526_1119 [Ectothiorhodosinus mongolicus]|uniref:Uncharacterized protein n=1 Tax=Ectothiorhodosinus mongolicus TaxID=233100 RepID=A0A1R3VZT0_9GAMM|nr:hypothetical protein [Ectothiorhodosinus mongolicus]ULX57039.1 hypothetical protein CKX93_04600 [Ectothiorhodosinus mongolicus]SIT69592.1 hypothetical protein SAMN05216526_1119 [Ectothiorhodosinus mongolicus]